MDAIKYIVGAMEAAGEPEKEVRSTADAMLDLLNFKSWTERAATGPAKGHPRHAPRQ
jgi:hypothetical protein